MGGLITEKQDLTYLTWSRIRRSSGTAGSFLKAYSELGGEKIYYKLSNYDSVRGVIGHECVNELIVDRLLDILGIEHLHYQLIPADARPKLHSLRLQDKAVLLEGLDGIVPRNLMDKIWEMIWKRWCAYEDFCNKG